MALVSWQTFWLILSISLSVRPLSPKVGVSCLNDCCPEALMSIAMKGFEWLVTPHSQPSCITGPLQFPYRPNCYTKDTISTLHSVISYMKTKTLTFISVQEQFSNTVILQRLMNSYWAETPTHVSGTWTFWPCLLVKTSATQRREGRRSSSFVCKFCRRGLGIRTLKQLSNGPSTDYISWGGWNKHQVLPRPSTELWLRAFLHTVSQHHTHAAACQTGAERGIGVSLFPSQRSFPKPLQEDGTEYHTLHINCLNCCHQANVTGA